MTGDGGEPADDVRPSDDATARAHTPLGDGAGDPNAAGPDSAGFDFETHRQRAVDDYQSIRGRYVDCAQAVFSVLKTALEVEHIRVHSIEARAKSIDSFSQKAAAPSLDDPGQPKYQHPVFEITDLAGVRVITFLLDVVGKVNEIVEREFEVIEKSDKSGLLEYEQTLGYQSIHYLVRFSPARCALPEYARFERLITEIQVRTILQHAWAEIEHDIQYKAVESIPTSIRGRFASLAGLLEIADREFQAISTEDQRGKTDARRLVAAGQIDRVEVTPDALKAYLDAKYGPDGRMAEWSYDWTARLLRRLGFASIGEVDSAISPYDDNLISRVLWGARQGQLTRFEDVLLAAMGEEFIERHPWTQGSDQQWAADWGGRRREYLAKLAESGVPVGTYRPSSP